MKAFFEIILCPPGIVAHAFNQHWGGGGRWISEFKANLIYRDFRDIQGHTKEPCLKRKQPQK